LYKPLAPLSGLLAAALLIGGLTVLVLDLGRPDRLIVAMTYYNFKSIFAWNIFLYTGFLAIVVVYLWMMLEKRFNKHSSQVGFVAFVWRLILTTGTGSIFGFLVARQYYDAAIMAPLFILMSFAFGLAIFNIVLAVAFKGTQRPLGDVLVERLRKLLGVFVASVLFFVAIFHLTNLYATEHHGVESFILDGDNVYTGLFWVGFMLFGSIIPLVLCLTSAFKKSLGAVLTASAMVIAGGLSQMYIIIIGGQAYPLELFPGKEVSSSFFDGVVNSYAPSFPEIALGMGGTALALFIVAFAVKVLRFLPESLANSEVDPHFSATEAEGEEATSAAGA
jgi:molybdopterin-containing oxidoreductase family membrane subunit